jgi:hypothetical protein
MQYSPGAGINTGNQTLPSPGIYATLQELNNPLGRYLKDPRAAHCTRLTIPAVQEESEEVQTIGQRVRVVESVNRTPSDPDVRAMLQGIDKPLAKYLEDPRASETIISAFRNESEDEGIIPATQYESEDKETIPATRAGSEEVEYLGTRIREVENVKNVNNVPKNHNMS